MLKRKRENKDTSRLFLLIGSFLLLFGLSIIGLKLYNDYSNKQQEEQAINDFIKIKQEDNTSTEEIIEEKNETPTNENYNFIAVIEIPKINLKRGLFPINDRNNNVDRNIEILKNSDMPNVKDGLLALAGHSGNSRIAYFHKLNKLENEDLVYIYFDNIKYTYEVFSIESQIKDGTIEITKSIDATELVLTTCDQQSKGKQVVVMARLIDEQPY